MVIIADINQSSGVIHLVTPWFYKNHKRKIIWLVSLKRLKISFEAFFLFAFLMLILFPISFINQDIIYKN